MKMKKSFLITVGIICFNLLSAQTDLSGRILDENNEPVVGATIRILHTLKGTSSNTLGEFYLKNVSGSPILLEYSSIGYKKKVDTIFPKGIELDIQVKMETEVYLADAFIVEATRASDNSPVTFSTMKKEEIQIED